MAIQMTRKEYEAKYGVAPEATPTKAAPVQMTQAEYDSKYGTEKTGGFVQELGKDFLGGIVKPAARFGQAVAGAGVGLFGSDEMKDNFNKAMQKTYSLPTPFGDMNIDPIKKGGEVDLGPVTIPGRENLSQVGDFAKTGSFVVGGGGAKNVVGQTLKGNILRGAGTGALVGGGTSGMFGFGEAVQDENATLGDIARETAGYAGIGAAAGGVLGGLAPIGTKAIKAIKPSSIISRVARISPSAARKFEDRAGKSTGEWLVDRGIYGTPEEITTQLYQRQKTSMNAVDDVFASIGGRHKSDPIKTMLDDLTARDLKVSTPGAPSPEKYALEGMLKKYNEGGLTMSEINNLKRMYERTVRLDYLRANQPEGVARATSVDSAVRNWQFRMAENTVGATNIKDLNMETALSKQLGDEIWKTYSGHVGNNAVSLTDWVLLSSDPTGASIPAFILKKGLGAPGFQANVAKLLGGKGSVGTPTATYRNPLQTNLLPQNVSAANPAIELPPWGKVPKGLGDEPPFLGKGANPSTILDEGMSKLPQPAETQLISEKAYNKSVQEAAKKTSESGAKLPAVKKLLGTDLPNKEGGFAKLPTGQQLQSITKSSSLNNTLTTKTLQKLKGRETVSKQFISDLTNSGDLKQVERDLIRKMLETEGKTVNVADFTNKVEAELLPLERTRTKNYADLDITEGFDAQIVEPRYEHVALPDDVRGNVANYAEHIYESPIETSAGKIHFGNDAPNYFGHTRVEDMAGKSVKKTPSKVMDDRYTMDSSGNLAEKSGDTRRIIEIQSDLYQKGNLFDEFNVKDLPIGGKVKFGGEDWKVVLDRSDKAFLEPASNGAKQISDKTVWVDKADFLPENPSLTKKTPKKGYEKLNQYNNPSAHFRMVREEIKRAADDRMEKLQFPTGETAMKVEGLGEADRFGIVGTDDLLGPELVETGLHVDGPGGRYYISEDLGNGRFRAIEESIFDDVMEGAPNKDMEAFVDDAAENNVEHLFETFDVSGNMDKNSPIYKFYEKDLQKYLKKNYDAQRIIDDQGVEWMEVKIKPEHREPVNSFGKIDAKTLLATAGTGGGLAALAAFGPQDEKTDFGMGSSLPKKKVDAVEVRDVGDQGYPEGFPPPKGKNKFGKDITMVVPDAVPGKYASATQEAYKDTGVPIKDLTALILTENPMWDEEFVNPQGSDTGLGQHNDNTYKDINKIYKKKYGESYDRKNGSENLKATALWINELLKKDHIKNMKDVVGAYRMGSYGYKQYLKGEGTNKYSAEQLKKMVEEKQKSYSEALNNI